MLQSYKLIRSGQGAVWPVDKERTLLQCRLWKKYTGRKIPAVLPVYIPVKVAPRAVGIYILQLDERLVFSTGALQAVGIIYRSLLGAVNIYRC
jgi:hypothetical protein